MAKPNETIELLKLIIADLSKDIRVVKTHVDSLKMEKHSATIAMHEYLDSNCYSFAKNKQKEIKNIDKKIDQFDCVQKSLEASRRPFEYTCIRLRQLYAERNRLMSFKHECSEDENQSVTRLEEIRDEIDNLLASLD